MSPEEAALKEHQREVVLVFLGLLGLGKYFHTLANDLGADNIEDLCNPNVLHPSDLEEPPLNMDPHDAHHLMAATAGAREAKAFLVAEGFEAYISSFIGIGVFRMEQLVDLSDCEFFVPSFLRSFVPSFLRSFVRQLITDD
jgi:hypothetical protein